MAVYEKLIGFDNNKYFLTLKGDEFIQMVFDDESMFTYEKQILEFIGKKISESKITQLQQNWQNA